MREFVGAETDLEENYRAKVRIAAAVTAVEAR
jgi:hypothetical protein